MAKTVNVSLEKENQPETNPVKEYTDSKTAQAKLNGKAGMPQNLYQKLSHVQSQMKVPKNLFNSYGGYNYRNAETILETAKPFLKEVGVTLILRDEIISVEGKCYVKAVATLIDNENPASMVETSALAREGDHKGMSSDQCPGCASSYARKYCLNGLFLLDDMKDEDSDEFVKEEKNKQASFSEKNTSWSSQTSQISSKPTAFTTPTKKEVW